MSNHSKHPDIFDHRHIGPNDSQIQSMLKTIDYNSLNDLIDTTIPPSIRFNHPTPESFNEDNAYYIPFMKPGELFQSDSKKILIAKIQAHQGLKGWLKIYSYSESMQKFSNYDYGLNRHGVC